MKKLKNFIVFFMCTIVMTCLIPVKMHADIGPKPSTIIEIDGLEDEVYYGTLLSQRSSGPMKKMSEISTI